MLAGILMVVVLIILILQGTLSGTGNAINGETNTFNNVVSNPAFRDSTPGLYVRTAVGNDPKPANAPCWTISGGSPICSPALSCPIGFFNNRSGECA